jgi:hypothetical protein
MRMLGTQASRKVCSCCHDTRGRRERRRVKRRERQAFRRELSA